MPLQPGDTAPDFRLPSHNGEAISLGDFRGKKPVVLLFFPLAFTSTCTEELCTVGSDFNAYQDLNAEVFAISVDSPYVLDRFRKECGAEFSFLSDFHREATEAFQVLRTDPIGVGLRGVADRSAFVIDRTGKVSYTWHSTNPGVIPPFDEIKAALARAA